MSCCTLVGWSRNVATQACMRSEVAATPFGNNTRILTSNADHSRIGCTSTFVFLACWHLGSGGKT
eukprot:4327184-Alexandrium_andersonii.AAC.1